MIDFVHEVDRFRLFLFWSNQYIVCHHHPICNEEEVLYSGSADSLAWENTINCAIFLKTSHRFKDDPEYGEILERFRMGENTHEDREEINK